MQRNRDANGNLTGYSDGSLSASYQYDATNRKLQESTHYGGFSLSYSYSYDRTIEYDPLLRPTRILALDPATNPLLDYQ
ncbi:hypothetical protein [Sedimenticola hydrogenitrophicus]|uniref:hypothetical protein n=1 Tax=Sedimenticola hydrogenitrophicus TaxID=2967975 RepID=UPI0023AF3DAD|nr:hypothetical protein [Sedimenticola hydrogenitrophicus]